MDTRSIMAGQTTYQNPGNTIPHALFNGREGRAAREFAQGWSHGKQGRTDLLGISGDYDAGHAITTIKAAA